MSDLKVGDVVFLKSGGPAMTVQGKASYGSAWLCAWFLNDEHKSATFTPETLTKEDPNSSKRPLVG